MRSVARRVGPVVCFAVLVPFALAQGTAPIPHFLVDLNHDGGIDSKDLLILIQKWGLEGISTPTPSPSSTGTATATMTNTPTPSASLTNTVTASPTETPTITDTPTATETPTPPSSFAVELPAPTPPSIRLIRVPAGSFMMGSPDTERSRNANEGPLHQVTIGYDFYLGQTEVTQAQWEAVMGSLPGPLALGSPIDPILPVAAVTWGDCQAFLAALNEFAQGTFRLPSEAEWEYACRAGSTSRFYFGSSLGCADECEDCDIFEIVIGTKISRAPLDAESSDLAISKGPFILLTRADFMWFCANAPTFQPGRSLRANSFGLFDMAGNVSEWVQDSYHEDYTGAPTDGSAWETDGVTNRVKRGGSYSDGADDCRSAARSGSSQTSGSGRLGFRVAWTP